MAKKKKKTEELKPPDWMTTYSDMITLCLCFFIIMFDPTTVTQAQLDAISESMRQAGIGSAPGGLTLSVGRSADLGNTIATLPSMERGRVMGTAMRRAVSLFSPEIRSNQVKVSHDERGLVITLAGDAFFDVASARINYETTRDLLLRIGTYLSEITSNPDQYGSRKFRIECHTDDRDVDPSGPWEDNWQLSIERSRAVLRYLTGLGISENNFQIAGFSSTAPVSSNDTDEGRANNRRVDIIILDPGHL